MTKENTILSCLKHFALYGASEAGRDYNTVDMSRIKMFNEYFPPYKAAVEAGCATLCLPLIWWRRFRLRVTVGY